MPKNKDRITLLKELRKLVGDNMDAAKMSLVTDEDISEFITDITDKRRFRKLKALRKDLDKLIDELTAENKLRLEERKYNDLKNQEGVKNICERFNHPA